LENTYLAAVFESMLEALYCNRMSEQLFHNDEIRWEVFVEIEGKVGIRWYLWVTRSQSVISRGWVGRILPLHGPCLFV
jgi:transposase